MRVVSTPPMTPALQGQSVSTLCQGASVRRRSLMQVGTIPSRVMAKSLEIDTLASTPSASEPRWGTSFDLSNNDYTVGLRSNT